MFFEEHKQNQTEIVFATIESILQTLEKEAGEVGFWNHVEQERHLVAIGDIVVTASPPLSIFKVREMGRWLLAGQSGQSLCIKIICLSKQSTNLGHRRASLKSMLLGHPSTVNECT